jgi:hypothetical protein
VANIWFKSYLVHWKQVLKISCTSEKGACQHQENKIWCTTRFGAWTSIIPIVHYINYLPLNIKEAKLISFADNTNILVMAEKDRTCSIR